MVTKENMPKLKILIHKRQTEGLTNFEDNELLFFRDNIHLQEHKNDAMVELQRRHANKALWLNKWGLIISVIISTFAIIISLIALFKPF